MTDGQDHRITVAAGPVDVLHRLALAVRPLDARTRKAAGPGLCVGRESAAVPGRRMPPGGAVLPLENHGATGHVLRYGSSGGLPATVAVRIDDPARRWIPRRFSVPLWTHAELTGADADPPTAQPVRADARLMRPWLLPGPAYPVPQGTTGIRLRVTRAGRPVRWPRVEAYGAPAGALVGWAHGDEHGQVLLLLHGIGVLPSPVPSTYTVALRSLARDPATAPPPDPRDALADLVVEAVTRSQSPPSGADLDNPLLRGSSRPPGYRTSTADTVHTLTVGQVVHAADLPHATA
ncbi:hypothetical protein [Streptomyces sp. AP-93]|uniref:hypothetical protein n=1 Tax=Streptomyces sp. AP-93 TaxID=2929048 RepID=UPI001FAEEDD6|nr:hypothetical protein [Streptomyces sp. AP-93]MCJ0874262.1 hypothetical protein [Streptomyces sp. AP-93]